MPDWPFGDIVPLSAGMVLADPPWRFVTYSEKGKGRSADRHYQTMPLPELKQLPVGQLAAPDSVLFMWATAPMLPDALELMKAWGFKYKTMGSWAKRSSADRSWAIGGGYILRSAMEPFLIGTIGEPEHRVRDERNLIVAPVREHSRKPDETYTKIERLWRGPYVELFARSTRPGWMSWGKEVGKFDERSNDDDGADGVSAAGAGSTDGDGEAARAADDPDECARHSAVPPVTGADAAVRACRLFGALPHDRGDGGNRPGDSGCDPGGCGPALGL